MKVLQKWNLFVLVSMSAICMTGCATSNIVEGRDFDSSVTTQIIKGKTTQNEILALLGQPYAKTLDQNDKVRWTYSYIKAVAHAQSGFFGGMDTTVNGNKKNLYITFDTNNVVENFTLDEGPIQRTEHTHAY